MRRNKDCTKRGSAFEFRRCAVAFTAWWLTAVSVLAQQPELPLLVSVSNSRTPLEAIPKSEETRFSQMLTDGERQVVLPTRNSSADNEAWNRFEAEFSPPPNSSSDVKRDIETLKYGLDTLVFAVAHGTKTIENYVDFSFGQDGLRPTRAISSEGSQINPRVKLDLNIGEDNKLCYMGVRIIIPFGK